MTIEEDITWESRPIHEAPYLFEAIPIEQRTLAGLWRRALEAHPDRDYVSFDGGDFATYAMIQKRVEHWSAIFYERGMRSGDRVAVMLPNQLDLLAIFFATASSSLTVVPINPDFRGEMLRHLLSDSGSKLLVTDAGIISQIDERWKLPALTQAVLLDGSGTHFRDDSLVVHNLRDLTQQPVGHDFEEVTPETPYAILYTSGTTGISKGVLLSHELIVFYAWSFAYAMGHNSSDTLFTPLPMFHANAQCVSLLPGLFVGARVAVQAKFSASRFWDQIVESGATHFAGMGAVANILMRRPESEYRPDHRLRHCHLVPAPENLPQFERRFNVPVHYSTYGLTEGQIVFMSRDGSQREGLIGKNHPYHEIRVVDANDREVPTGEPGEMIVRPLIPNIMFREYIGRPEATLEAFRGLWFHTGDLVSRDPDGNLWFLGRVKDAIRRRGENISAFEVEREVANFGGVDEVAAIGVKADVGEEEVLVALTLQPGVTIDPIELYRYCAERLPGFMVPRYFDIRDELPKNASHKILKTVLRQEGVRERAWDSQLELAQ